DLFEFGRRVVEQTDLDQRLRLEPHPENPMRSVAAVLFAIETAALAVAQGSIPVQSGSCERISRLDLRNGSVTQLEVGPARACQAPRDSNIPPALATFATLPAFCRVSANLKPSADSDINIEVWMPIEGWNGKFEAVGNGGWGGAISYGGLATALARGYATA